jgi:hypothetical protein
MHVHGSQLSDLWLYERDQQTTEASRVPAVDLPGPCETGYYFHLMFNADPVVCSNNFSLKFGCRSDKPLVPIVIQIKQELLPANLLELYRTSGPDFIRRLKDAHVCYFNASKHWIHD